MRSEEEKDVLHTSQVRVRMYDIDAMGAVFFTCYQKWLDSIALIELFREKGINWSELSFFLVNVNFDYEHPLYLDDLVDVRIESVEFGNKSMKIHGGIYIKKNGKMAAGGTMVYVFVDKETGEPISVPGEIKEKL